MGMKLFGDEGGAAGDISKIEINQEFARRFEHNKKREDLQRYEELKKKGVIDDSEEDNDESSDDDEEIVNYSTKQDLKFFDALIKVRNKDPALKNNDAKLFDSDNEEDDDVDEGGDGKKEKKKKPMFLKDVNAKHLIGNGPEFDDEDDERDDKNRKKSYFEEQEEVRKEFLDAVADEEDDDGELLKVKNDNTGGDEGEDEDDREFEKKLDEYFKEDDKLDENEKFLKDYFRKKMWLDKDSGKSKGFDIEIDVSEDEEELEKQEDYEREFNFRYEENAGDRVMGHSRKVDGSVRKKESSRKIQRMNKKERMAQAELERNEELKRLKNLKKKEMNEKLRKIREIAGFGENDDCLLDEHDLEQEFDPDEYDRKMKNTFGDNFYEADDVDPSFGSDEEHGELEKPDFDKEDDLLRLPKGWEDEHRSGDGFLAFRDKILKKKVKNEGNEEQLQDEEGKRKRKRSKLEEELIKKELEEMYKLECEDTIGDLKTRFKYKSVDKNTYGLKPKEILLVDEKELNQIVPLKKLATYREDEFVVPRHKLKEQKQKIKSLLRGESSDGQSNGGKKRKHDVGQTEPEKSKSDAENEDQQENEDQKENEDKKELSRKQRRKMRLKELKISDKRRMAYEGSTAKSNKKKKHKSKDAVYKLRVWAEL